MRSFPSTLLAAVLVAGAAAAHAQSVCERGPFRERLEDRYVNDICKKENAATDKRVKEIEKAFERKDKHPARIAREQLELLVKDLEKRVTAPAAEPLRKSLGEAITRIADLPNMEALADRDTNAMLQRSTWQPSSRPSALPSGFAAQMLTAAGCMEDTGSARCREHFQSAVAVGDEVFVAYHAIVELHAPMGERFRDLAALRGKRWHSYLYDTQFQYWWELGLNRWREETCFDRVIVDLFSECQDQKRDRYDNPLGFRDPPTNRAVFLHPDVGLQYIDAEPDGDRFKPTLLIQWFGYQWWDWKDNSEKITGLRGVSFVSTLSDNATAKTLGWGAMFQVNQYAVAFTGHGSKLAVTLNLTLGDKISKLNDEWADKLKRLKD